MADEVRYQQWSIAAATMLKIHNAAATKKEHLIRDWAVFHPLLVKAGVSGDTPSNTQQVTAEFNRAMYDALQAAEAKGKS